MWIYRCQKGKKEKSEQNWEKENQLEMLHSHDARSFFFVFSVPLRASNSRTICPEYRIQSYVRRPENLKENPGAYQQPTMLSFTILLHVHHAGRREKPNHPIQVFRGPFREHSLQFYFFFLSLAANWHGMIIGLCRKRACAWTTGLIQWAARSVKWHILNARHE